MEHRTVWRRVLQIGTLTALALALTAGVAYADDTATPTFSIQGHIGQTSGDWAGAAIAAVPYQLISGKWQPVGGSDVATDGTYSIDGLAAGTYRVGFTDSNRVYADDYYDSITTTVGAAADISVVATNVTGIDQTLTALPALQITGHVNYVGAPPVSGDVQAEIYSLDASGTWAVVYTTPVADDGTYDVHLATADTYRVGFSDTSNLFGDVYYDGASTLASATGIPVVADSPVTGVNATMTAKASARVGSTDAVANAIAISQSQFDDGVGGPVIICTADNWPDSLASTPYAHALNCPILLVHKKTVDASVIAELNRLQAEEVVIVGGASSVSVDDEMAIRAAGFGIVRRLAGADRYGTSVAIAQEMLNRGLVLYDENGNLMNVAVATGASFTDAICGAPAAAAQSMPLLLIQKSKVPAAVSSFLAANETSATQVLAFGGTGSLSDSTLNLVSIAPSGGVPADNVTRVGDSDAFRTSVAIAGFEQNNLGWSDRQAMLSSNKNYADAIAVGPVLATNQESLLLTAPALKSKKVAHSPKPYGYTQLSPSVEAFVSKQTTPSIDPAAVGYTSLDDTSTELRDFNIGRIDALGNATSLPADVWNYALTVAGIPH